MKKTCTRTLTAAQADAFEQLTGLCRAHDKIRLSCPLDGDRFYLLTGESPDGTGRPVLNSAIAVFEGDGLWECYGFTRPDARRRGYFNSLLEMLEQDAAQALPEPDLCFVADPNSSAAVNVLAAIGAELWYEEYAMEWNKDACGNLSPAPLSPSPLRLTSVSGGPESRLDFTAWLSGDQKAGSFSLYLQPPSACLFEVEIAEPFRGRGLGQAMIRQLQDLTPAIGISTLTLQVSGDNLPALRLYKKTGFHITDTLSYYLY